MTCETPTTDERLSRASNASDLTVTPDRKGDAVMLIAAGKTPRVVGRHLIALYGEWDNAAPRRWKEHDFAAVLGMLAPLPKALVYSPAILENWTSFARKDIERRAREVLDHEYERAVVQAFSRMKSLGKASAGLVDIVRNRITDPERKVRSVLLWWLNPRCPTCNGTKYQVVPGTSRQSSRPCETCHGSGDTPRPYGHDGMVIEREIGNCIERAKRDIGHGRKNILMHLR